MSASPRRLPGVKFEVQPPPLAEALPRMDVAVFVGFAASGPLHLPVTVEDSIEFAEVFGEDVPLAWDAQQGEMVRSYLGSTVRAFFRNGGRRCWVIRVAGEGARANLFPIPAMARAEYDAHGRFKRITPAMARARSEGSWSDSLQVGANIVIRPVEISGVAFQNNAIEIEPASASPISEGDLLRLSFRGGEGYVAIVPVNSRSRTTVGSGPVVERITSSRALWFRTAPLLSSATDSVRIEARVFSRAPSDAARSAAVFDGEPVAILNPPSDWYQATDRDAVTLELAMPIRQAPSPGSLVRVDVGHEQLWVTVEDSGIARGIGSPPGDAVRVTGRGLWVVSMPHPLPTEISTSEVITFDLSARKGTGYSLRVEGLGFIPEHSRFWATLPTDSELYSLTPFTGGETPELWQEGSEPRFPIAGWGTESFVYFPIAMPILPEYYLNPIAQAQDKLARDGLARFDSSLFLDPDLVQAGVTSFTSQADFVRYFSESPRPLTGIHGALGFKDSSIIEEATIIAAPDALHRGWFLAGDNVDLEPFPEPTPADQPVPGQFQQCETEVIAAPSLHKGDVVEETGSFTLFFEGLIDPEAVYVLQESSRADFSDSVMVYEGAEDELTTYGKAPGDYFFRLRSEVNGRASEWSAPVAVRVHPPVRWRLNPIESYSADHLLAVHRSLLRMCAARADLLAVLCLPEHYRDDDAVAYVKTLKSRSGPVIPVGARLSLPLGSGEALCLSYASVYHPWLIGREQDGFGKLRQFPPDGASSGILARRAVARGAWVAPANELIHDILALTPPIQRDRWRNLQDAQINLIRQEPRGFLSMSADTLSDDVSLVPINVRRLLILLRRMALREGNRYVFEPNDDSLRRLVQRGFEAMLDDMFVRGAFSGATAATSYQVVTSNSLNTRQSVEQGRFIVELKVAPSLPMSFITIRLVQTGDRGFVVEGR